MAGVAESLGTSEVEAEAWPVAEEGWKLRIPWGVILEVM